MTADKITTKQELDEYLAHGVSGDLYRLLGVCRVNLYPFETLRLESEQRLIDLIKGKKDYAEIKTTVESVSGFIELEFSTVYHGMRFYFQNGEDLKRFCDIAESK